MKRKPLPLPLPWLVALALPCVVQSVAAQTVLPTVNVQQARDADPAYNPSASTTAAKINAPLRDIPQSVNVVPQQVIQDQGAKSMEAVLRNVPGIGLGTGDGQRDQVTIRGFTAIGDQFVDGLRDDALYYRDLSNVERVEVLKGPASVLYGRGSSGGLINRITKKPGVDKTELVGTVGSWNQKRGEFDIGRNLGGDHEMSFRVTGAVERSGSYRDQGFLDREALAPSLSMKLTPQTTLLLQADHLRDKRVTDFGIPAINGRPVSVSPSTYYGAANAGAVDTSESEVNSVGFTLDHKFNDRLALHNAFRRYEYTLTRNNTLVASVTPSTASLSHSNVLRNEDGWFNQTEITQKLQLAGMKHQLLYGVEVGKQNKDQYFATQTGVGTVSLFNPVLPVVPLNVSIPPGSVSTNNTGIMTTTSAYVQDLVALSKTWKALAGLRYDRFEQELQNRIGPNAARTDGNWSPRAGLVWQPSLDQSYYASVSKSFQPSGETFGLVASGNSANAQLAPEQTTNYELGTKLDFFNGNASMNAAVFNLQRTNIKFADPSGVLVPIGTQRTRGVEVSFSGALPGNWNIWSGYSFMDAEVTASPNAALLGKGATLTPRNSASAWLTKALGSGWRAGGGVSYVGDRWADPTNTTTLPAYVKFDAMVGYKLAKLDLQLNLNNLFNKGYIVSGHGSSPLLNMPGAPRNAQLTARYNF